VLQDFHYLTWKVGYMYRVRFGLVVDLGLWVRVWLVWSVFHVVSETPGAPHFLVSVKCPEYRKLENGSVQYSIQQADEEESTQN